MIPVRTPVRQIDDCRAAGGSELCELIDDDGLIAPELPVVPAIGDMPESDGSVLVGQCPAQLAGIDPTENRLDAG